MNDINPYASPQASNKAPSGEAPTSQVLANAAEEPTEPSPSISTQRTLLPRHLAAILDNLLALVISAVAVRSIDDEQPLLKFGVMILVYLGYFLLSEGLIGRSPCKLMSGLVVVQLDGRRCTWRQTLIRTLFRLLEVNPLLLGGLPAAISIFSSTRRQRIGDRVAGTIVVCSSRRFT